MNKVLAYLGGGMVVAAVIIASSSGSDALPLLTMQDCGDYSRLVINTDGQFRVSGSNDGVTWTVIEPEWDTVSLGRTMAIDHQRVGYALFKAEPL